MDLNKIYVRIDSNSMLEVLRWNCVCSVTSEVVINKSGYRLSNNGPVAMSS